VGADQGKKAGKDNWRRRKNFIKGGKLYVSIKHPRPTSGKFIFGKK